MEFITKTKRWGNSIGVIVPKKFARKEEIRPDEDVIIEIRKKNVLREAFGSLKNWNIDPQQMKDNLRKEW